LTDLAWQQDLKAEQRVATAALRQALRSYRGIPVRLRQAMAHSLLGGGKRLRPVLVHWTWDALGGRVSGRRNAVDRATVQRVGAAVEMIHTYSLIHDDLPAMDDDVLRRGRPTCHVAFDEATAILAGDALQALAFEILAGAGPRAAELVATAAAAAGPAGMVGGQMLDLQAETQAVTLAAVKRIHAAKTAAMIGLCLAAGGICRGAGPAQIAALTAAGRRLGLAFQGADDLLDLSASSQDLGKTPGKDLAAGKATWVRLEGIEAAAARTRRLGRQGERQLRALLAPGPAAERLLALAGFMWQRRS
jgi:geranylgeranyl pyrophosphate synthase